MRLFLFLGLALTLLACARPTEEVEDRSSRPNILLIVADDLGYTDLGSYGSEIHTPTLDQLAAQGVRFRRFHTYPTCAPTRAALLAGTDNHVAGVDSQLRESDGWGYEGHLTDRVVPIPRVLSEAGYHTYTTGKWHLGHEDGQRPAQKGFERTFVLHQGAANHYTDTGFVSADRPSTYSSNGTRVEWPDGEYSTEVYTDSLMEYIGEPKGDPRPFFAYAAYTSPHWPL